MKTCTSLSDLCDKYSCELIRCYTREIWNLRKLRVNADSSFDNRKLMKIPSHPRLWECAGLGEISNKRWRLLPLKAECVPRQWRQIFFWILKFTSSNNKSFEAFPWEFVSLSTFIVCSTFKWIMIQFTHSWKLTDQQASGLQWTSFPFNYKSSSRRCIQKAFKNLLKISNLLQNFANYEMFHFRKFLMRTNCGN